MFLNELFRSPRVITVEGGNVRFKDLDDPNLIHSAEKIDLKKVNRTQAAQLIKEIINNLNQSFQSIYQQPIFGQELFQSNEYLSGSSKHFFNTDSISDKEFAKYKTKVGDIDIQCDIDMKPQIEEFLNQNYKKQFGPGIFLGYSSAAEQFNSLFYIPELKLNIQIDFEFGAYDKETGHPTEWFKFSHSSEWNDITANIKGVFHKWIYRALPAAKMTSKYVAAYQGLGKKRAIQIEPEPIQSRDISFAVASSTGGGASTRYKPYLSQQGLELFKDPQGNEIELGPNDTRRNNPQYIPIKQEIPSTEKNYIQNLDKQFEMFFGVQPSGNDKILQRSYLGTLELMNKYLTEEQISMVFEAFIEICFDSNAQMIERDDPKQDFEIKFAAIDKGLEVLKISNKESLRNTAVTMAQSYENDFNDLQSFKKYFNSLPKSQQDAINVTGKGQIRKGEIQYRSLRNKLAATGQWPVSILKEQDEKNEFLRKGIPHLYSRYISVDKNTNQPIEKISSMEMKNLDFISICNEIAQNGGTLNNIGINLKVDGAGIRFGKDESGRPFFMTSKVGPVYAKDVGIFYQNTPGDKERARKYDMALDIIVNSKFINLLPDNTIVQAEMMYDTDMTPDQGTKDQKTFVNIPYDIKKLGKVMTLVPFMVSQYKPKAPLPNEDKILKKLITASNNQIKILSNRLQQSEINVGSIIAPIVNMSSQLIAALQTRGNSPEKQEAQNILTKTKQELSNAIIESPKLKGMEILGPFNEGIVVNMPSGMLFKVTSQKMKSAMLAKLEEKKYGDPTVERVAVVAIGNFMGHIGHEELINLTIDKAEREKAKAFIFVGNKVGPDDPLSVGTRLKTLQLLFPNLSSDQIRPLTSQEMDSVDIAGQMTKKIEYELVKTEPFYNNILIAAGDGEWSKTANNLTDRFKRFKPLKHVVVSTFSTKRGTGMSGTLLRSALSDSQVNYRGKKISTETEQEKFNFWRMAYSPKLNDNYIRNLMSEARNNMGITYTPNVPKQTQQSQQTNQQTAPTQTPISEVRLSNILIRPNLLTTKKIADVKMQLQEAQTFDFEGEKQTILKFIDNVLNNKPNNRQYNPFYGLIVGNPKVGAAGKIGLGPEIASAWKSYFNQQPWIGVPGEPWRQINLGDNFAKSTGNDRTLNLYFTVNKEKNNVINFLKNIYKLARYLQPISQKYKTPIKFKTHALLDSFIGHNDSFKVYYYDAKVKTEILAAVNQWLGDSNIVTGNRTHTQGVDIKSGGGSFGQILSNHVYDKFTKLIQTYGNKFTPEDYFNWLKQNLDKLIKQVTPKEQPQEQGVAEGLDDNKFIVADKVEELVRQYALFSEKGWFDLFTKLAGRKLDRKEYIREMEYASKFLRLLDRIRMMSEYRGKQDPERDQELIDLSNQWLSLFNKAVNEFKGTTSQGMAENYYSDLMKQTYAKFFKPAPPKTILAVKKFLSGIIISLATAQDNDYDEQEPEEINWKQDLSDVREAYDKLRSNNSPNWFDLADAVFSYDTEFRESMLEWAEEELGSKLVDILWHEVWQAKQQISRADASHNVDVDSGQKVTPHKPYDPEKYKPDSPRNIEWQVMINGEPKIKFGGVSNNKEAAMKTGLSWARNHGYEREVQAGKVEVVQIQQSVKEGTFDKAAKEYEEYLLNNEAKIRDFLSKTVRGWIPTEQDMLKAIKIAVNVMRVDGDINKAGQALRNELNTLHSMSLHENLRKWFKDKWVRFGPDGKIRGDCARGSDSEGKPKCLPQSKAHALGKKGRASAATRKRREDPNPERSGKAINVSTKKKSNEGMIQKNLAESKIVTRIDSKKIEDFSKNMQTYYHTKDFSKSGQFDKGFKIPKEYTGKMTGVYAGDPTFTALYATGNANQTRYVAQYGPGQPIVYFDRKDVPDMRGRRTYLTVFDGSKFKKLPTGEYFSDDPGKPLKQQEITDPFQYIKDQGWEFRIVDDLPAVLTKLQKLNKKDPSISYGSEGIVESSKQSISEDQLDEKCWDTYKQVGMKKKGGKMVPNCVPKESRQYSCPHCNGPMFSEELMQEKRDACYYKVKRRYKVWPSAYASGALVKCRKRGAKNWGKKSESIDSLQESIDIIKINLIEKIKKNASI